MTQHHKHIAVIKTLQNLILGVTHTASPKSE